MGKFAEFNKAVNAEELAGQLNEAKNNPQNSGKEVPAGNYTVAIEKMEIKATKDGRPMFSVMCRILEGEFKKYCLFMNRVIAGTKNDINMIASVIGWLDKLETETVAEFNGDYDAFVDNVADIFQEVADSIELDVTYDPNAFNSISITGVYDA